MKLFRYILLFCFSFSGLFLKAQDPHFSQYFSAPLTLNPAATGAFEGDHRVVANMRQQSMGSGVLFNTGTISFDTKLIPGKIDGWDNWGLGVMALSDRSSGGALQSTYLGLSTAYHKALGEDGLHTLGVGFQATYASKFIDINKLSFASQFSSGGFDATIPAGEDLVNNSVSYFDFNTGLLYSYKDEVKNFYFGASAYHLLQPKQTFFDGNDNRVLLRGTLQAGAGFLVNDMNQLHISSLYMQQGAAKEIALGGAYGYSFGMEDENKFLYVGAWYRLKDAWYPYVGMQLNNVQAGISYDVHSASWSSGAVQKSRSIELSFIYIFKKEPGDKFRVPCAKF